MTGTMGDMFAPPVTRAGRSRRRRRRLTAAAAAVVLAVSAAWVAVELVRGCGSLNSDVRRIDGECVGVTDGSYVFNPRFERVLDKIADENASVRDTSDYVTVALLDPWGVAEASSLPAEMVHHRLQGAYTALRRINHGSAIGGDRRPQVQLVLANEGNTERQWRHVVDQLVDLAAHDEHPLVAVIGLGVSTGQTRSRAMALSGEGIPMVAAVLTADTLNYDEITGMIKTSPSNEHYVAALHRYIRDQDDIKDAVLVYDANSDSGEDLFTKTLRDEFQHQMADLLTSSAPLTFTGRTIPTGAGPALFDNVTTQICAERPDAVLYAGREVDLGGFIESLSGRVCDGTPVVVLTAGSDLGAVLEEREPQLREAMLTVVFAGTVDAKGWAQGVPGTPEEFAPFLEAFRRQGFDPADLADGGAIMTHDALLTATRAIRLAASSGNRTPNAADVLSQVLNLNGIYSVPCASGELSFSKESAGNPAGKPIPVFGFPSAEPPGRSRQVGEPYITG